jgi:L-ascorbate metabolism protein UlaG (beta-lactamase superfamily)
MRQNRRRFLKYALAGAGAAAGLGAYWVGTSQRRAARLVRMLFADARRQIAPAPVKPDPQAWSDNAITLSWIGHATILLNFYGVRILTDPAFGERIGVSLGLGTVGPKRYVAPALGLQELPPIDVVLLSHAHMDHMDLSSLRRLAPGCFTVTASATSDVLAGTLVKELTELRWGERTRFRGAKGDVEIEAFEVKHWGQRWPSELPRGYNGYVLRREGKAILFGGDTAQTRLFAGLRSRGPFEAAIMPIGAYNPWIWNHCSPEQAVELANLAGARYIVPVHHQTFRLSHEPMNEPLERFEAALDGERARIALRRIGETFVCPTV